MNADWLRSTPETFNQKLRRYVFVSVLIFIFGYGVYSICRDFYRTSKSGFLPCNEQARALAWKTYEEQRLHENIAFQNRKAISDMADALGGELAIPFDEAKEHEEAVLNIVAAHRQLVYDLNACGCDYVDGPPKQ